MASVAEHRPQTRREKRAANMAAALGKDGPLTVRIRLRLTRPLHGALLDLLSQCPEEELGPVVAQLAQWGALHKTAVESALAFPSAIEPATTATRATAAQPHQDLTTQPDVSPLAQNFSQSEVGSFLSLPGPATP